MRVLVLYAHPVETSFTAALHAAVIEGLHAAGHNVDNCDLYAENFNPVLSRAERLAYHAPDADRRAVAPWIARLEAAEALVLISPVWNFGYPAILKGFFDRVFLPGVTFAIDAGVVVPGQIRLRRVAAVHTYGAPRWAAFLAADPPRRFARRILRRLFRPERAVRYLALYDMNRATPEQRAAFLARVAAEMKAL
jgi:putative NADPH-quinone reductase